MDSNPSKWKERLRGYVNCRFCDEPIFYWEGAVYHWLHEGDECGEEAIPALHDRTASAIQQMGTAHARMGATHSDNPYGPDGPLYDGVDSMGEALAWHTGWEAGRCENGEPLIVVKPDDLDYLEFERD